MTLESDVVARVLTLASQQFGLPLEQLAPEQDLFDALGIDSVQALELLSTLERTFNVELPDYELADVRSFADLAERLADRL